jgi:hypothetical protein
LDDSASILVIFQRMFLFAKGGPSANLGKVRASSLVKDVILREWIGTAPDANEDLSYAEGLG